MRELCALKAPRSEAQVLTDFGLINTTQSSTLGHLLTLRRNAHGWEHQHTSLEEKRGRGGADDLSQAYETAAKVAGADLAIILRVAIDGESRRQRLTMAEVRQLRRALDRLTAHFGA